MVLKGLRMKLSDFIKKNKYVGLVLIAGLLLMLIPGKTSRDTQPEPVVVQKEQELSDAQELAQILSMLDGAGEVNVFLTVAVGEEILYQTDDDTSVNGENRTTQVKTVTVTNSQKDETGLIRQTNPPVYRGAIIVCQGGDDPQVRLAIVNAVSNVTGLGADRISVLKMK